MFKRLLLISGLLAFVATAFIYKRFMLPEVDVTTMDVASSHVLPDEVRAGEGHIVSVAGVVDRTGTTMLGKREVLLTDEAGAIAVFCTFVVGEPQTAVNAGDNVTVKGVWHPMEQNNPGVPVVIGRLTDCIAQ
jgi:hypothetical protein